MSSRAVDIIQEAIMDIELQIEGDKKEAARYENLLKTLYEKLDEYTQTKNELTVFLKGH